MELRHFKLVKTVVEEGSLTKAATRLFLSQSALSHQLKEIEGHFSTKIFHRENRTLKLTEVGKVILEGGTRILQTLDETEKEVNRIVKGEAGTIGLCLSCYTCYHWLPPILKEFNLAFPNVEVNIIHKDTEEKYYKSLGKELDILIVYDYEPQSGLVFHQLFKDELVVVLPSSHPWQEHNYFKTEFFENQELIIQSYPLETAVVYYKLIQPAGVKLRKVTPVPITEAAIDMVKSGFGIAVLPRWLIRPYLKSPTITTLPVTKDGLPRTWYAVTKEDKKQPAYLKVFIDSLKEHIKTS